MFLWLELDGVDSTALLPVAIDHGTAFVPGPAFAATTAASAPDHPLRSSLRVSFATAGPEALVEAADRLAGAVSAMYRA